MNDVNRPPALLLHLDSLLRIALQRSGVVSLRAQPLNRVSDRSLIGGERVSDQRIVVDILRHHLQNLGEVNERDESRIESLLLGRVRERGSAQVWIRDQPVVNIQNLLRVRGRRHDLREQGIGIKRDRRQQLVEFLGRRE